MRRGKIIEEYSILLSLGALLEVAGYPKPGNVHRLRDFNDIWFEDFLISSHIILLNNFKALKRGLKHRRQRYSIGDLIYSSLTRSMMLHGGGNTCLGIALILHPLAYTSGVLLGEGEEPTAERIASSTPSVLREYTTPYDTVMFYKAVRRASPSYIRATDETGGYPNVWDEKYTEKILKHDITLYEILDYSSKRDLVASEIVSGYSNVLTGRKYLEEIHEKTTWNFAVVGVFLYLGSTLLDTVVARSLGYNKAVEVRRSFLNMFKIFERTIKRGSGYNLLLDKLSRLDKQLANANVRLGAIADLVAATISLYAVDKRRKIIHE